MDTKLFAAIGVDENSHSGAVYGLGHTKAEAVAEALGLGLGDIELEVVPCSEQAYDFVCEYGGAPHPRLVVCASGVDLADE